VVVISSFWVYGSALSFLCLVFSSLTGEILGVGGLRIDTWTYDCLLKIPILYTSYDCYDSKFQKYQIVIDSGTQTPARLVFAAPLGPTTSN
jgi:hypothetical protein